jgi:hypothetical protein
MALQIGHRTFVCEQVTYRPVTVSSIADAMTQIPVIADEQHVQRSLRKY